MPVIKQQRQMYNKAIGVRSFDDGSQQVGQAVTNLANTVSKDIYERSAKKAEEIGIEQGQSVPIHDLKSFDPATGKLQAMSDFSGMGSIATDAFNKVVDRRFVDSVDKDIRLKSSEIANKYPNPSQYQSMFEDYLNSLSKGASNKYKNVIMESGSYLMASTRIKLANVARSKARSAEAKFIVGANKEAVEVVYDAANSQNYVGAIETINARVTATKDGESAGLLKQGSSQIVQDNLSTELVAGALPEIIKSATGLQQTIIKQFVNTQGSLGGLEHLSEEQKEVLLAIQPFLTRGNARENSISTNSIITGENQVRAENLAIIQKKLDEEAALAEEQLKLRKVKTAEDFALSSSAMLKRVFANFNSAWETNSLANIGGALLNASSSIDNQRKNLLELLSDEVITASKFASQLISIRQAALDPILVSASLDGNPEALIAAIASNGTNIQNMGMLTDKQQAVVEAMTDPKNSIYVSTEDLGFVKDRINSNQNDKLKSLELLNDKTQLFNNIETYINKLIDNGYDESADSELQAYISEVSQSELLSAPEKAGFTKRIGIAAGEGIVNAGAEKLSAIEMIQLSKFILTGGKDLAGIENEYVKQLGLKVVDTIEAVSYQDVASHANSIATKKSSIERAREEELNQQKLLTKVSLGQGQSTNPKHREAMDKLLVLNDVDIFDKSSKTDEVYNLMKSTIPQSLIDGLDNAVLTLDFNGIDVLLDHYAVLSNDIGIEGVAVNRFGVGSGAVLSPVTQAILTNAVKIRSVTGDSGSNILSILAENRSDPKAKGRIEESFKKKSSRIYVAEELGFGYVIGAELAPLAEYYVGSGMSDEAVGNAIASYVEKTYTKSNTVLDPRFPSGLSNRSLEVMFPNDDRRMAFVSTLNRQLAEIGYRLNDTSGANDYQFAGLEESIEKTKNPLKDAFLIPVDGTSGPTYHAYYKDKNDIIQPIVEEINGKAFFVMFDEDELEEYDLVTGTITELREQKEKEAAEQFRVGMPVITKENAEAARQNALDQAEFFHKLFGAFRGGTGK